MRFSGLSEIEHLGLWTDLGAFPAMRAGVRIKAYPQGCNLAHQGVESAQWTEMATPAVSQNQQIEQKDTQ